MTPCLGPELPQTMLGCDENMGGVRLLSVPAFYSRDRLSSEMYTIFFFGFGGHTQQ